MQKASGDQQPQVIREHTDQSSQQYGRDTTGDYRTYGQAISQNAEGQVGQRDAQHNSRDSKGNRGAGGVELLLQHRQDRLGDVNVGKAR